MTNKDLLNEYHQTQQKYLADINLSVGIELEMQIYGNNKHNTKSKQRKINTIRRCAKE